MELCCLKKVFITDELSAELDSVFLSWRYYYSLSAASMVPMVQMIKKKMYLG